MTINFILHRVLFQSVTMLLCLISLGLFISIKIRSGGIPSSLCGIGALLIHVIVFYTFVFLDTFGVFSITAFANSTLGTDVFSFGLWSSALRLQTAIEILLMSLTVRRRYIWIRSLMN